MTTYKLQKEWNNVEEVTKKILKVFSKYEKENLIITYGRRERTVSDTYGFPYTSSSDFAMISNCNVLAELKGDRNYRFDWLALTEENEIVAGFTDYDENEKLLVIGKI